MSDRGSRRGSVDGGPAPSSKAQPAGDRDEQGSTAGSSKRGSFSSVRSSASKGENGSQDKVEEGDHDRLANGSRNAQDQGENAENDGQDVTKSPTSEIPQDDDDDRSTRSKRDSSQSGHNDIATASTSLSPAHPTGDNVAVKSNVVTDPTPDAPKSPAADYAEAAGREARPFSLAAPETPSASTSAPSPLRESANANQSAEDSQWRDSTMDSVALSETVPLSPISDSGSIVNRFQSVSFADAEAGPSTPSTSHRLSGTSSNLASKRLSVRSDKSSSGHNYDLIAQHAHSLEAELQSNPKRKRRSEMGSADLRASFAKLRDEAEHAAGAEGEMSRRASAATETDEDGQPIDWDLWGEIMNDYEGMAKERPKELSKAIQNGIPPALRGMMWQLMSASKDPELEAVYSKLMKQSSPHEKAIIRDLNRTFPTHEYFHDGAGVGQGNLLNIMKAYSLYDEEVGYCQGMAFVVGPLLLNMPDEEAFCVLVRLMKSYDLRSQYVPDMPGLQLRLFQFDRLLEELVPAVFMHLLRQGIKSSMYASQWFLTLLAYRFPLELVCSVFDLIFAEGVEAIFRFALALMRKNEQAILQLEFEQLLEFLKTGLFEHYKLDLQDSPGKDGEASYSAQSFVREALQVKITPMMLDQFAAEWAEMLRQQNAQNMEVEQLRSINKKLSAQVRSLEASLAQINQEHCELVKQVVSTRLEKEELEDELVRVKMALAQESLLREEGRGSIASRSSFASFGSFGLSRTPDTSIPDRRDSSASKASKQ